MSWFRTGPDPVDLAMQAAQELGPKAATDPVAEIDHQAQLSSEPTREIAANHSSALEVVTEYVGLAHSAPAKGTRTAVELAAMILNDLRQIDGCPKRGVSVTVYGSNPWNAWLSFGTAAGPVPNKTEIQTFCEIVTDRLKRLYNVSD